MERERQMDWSESNEKIRTSLVLSLRVKHRSSHGKRERMVTIIMELGKWDAETGKEDRGTFLSPATQSQLPERGSHFPVMGPICPFRSANRGDLPYTNLAQLSRKGSVHCFNDNVPSRTAQKAWGSSKVDGVRCGRAR